MLDVGFRVDAGAAIGGGHLARCAALAAAMVERNWRTCLYGTTETNRLAENIEGFSVRKCLDGAAAIDAQALPGKHDLLVVDHYGLDAEYETRAHEHVQSVLVISDRPASRHACEMLLDQNLDRVAAEYRGLTPADCAILVGPDYVLLRPVYSESRRASAPKLRAPALNLLVSFGGSDPQNATGLILRMLKNIARPQWRIRVVLGPSFVHHDAITKLAQNWQALEIERSPGDLFACMHWADAAISASGGTMWELCFMGLPFAVLVAGAIPNGSAQRLQKHEAAIDLGTLSTVTPESLSGALRAIMDDQKRRHALATNAFRLIDGRGAERVCDAIEKRLCVA